jgi:hypothetical protein
MPGGPEPGGPPTTGGPVVAAAGRLRLLTRPQLENSLRDLLGPIELPPTQQDAATHGFASVSASAVKLTDSGVEQFHGAVRTVLNKLVADPARRGGLTGECVPASAGDEACFRKLISGFGRRAWRRPLEGPEIDRYTKLAVSAAGALGNDVNQGLIYGFAGLLASPNFLYRVEIGQPDPGAGGRYRYSGHELASRISYFLTGSTPDSELLTAADSGALARADGVRAQVSRLVGSPRGRDGLRSYVREFMNLDDFLTRANADEDPRYTASLRAAMAEEVVRLFQSRLDPGTDVMGLFDAGSTFVNAELAGIYGIPGVSGTDLVPATFPAQQPRLGLLGMGLYLAASVAGKGKDTSPTGRGVFVLEQLLCTEPPEPPGDVDTNLKPLPAGVVLTNRERMDQHRSDPACAACHAAFDPLGYAFEVFDWVGAYREKVADKVIDPTVDWRGEKFANARELVQHLRKDQQARKCLVAHLFRYANGHLETALDEAELGRWDTALTGANGQLGQMLTSVVASDDFRFVSPAP